MKLDQLTAGADCATITGDSHIEITGLSYDSRSTMPGHLFFALARDPELNRAHMKEALNRGARAMVVGGWDEAKARPAATLIESDRPRWLMARAASRFYNRPSQRLELAGITGTSGKTTTAYLLASIFEASGRTAGIIGTTGVFIGGRLSSSGLTTPESIDFEAALAAMEGAGIRSVAAEISSIGLAEGRVEELDFSGCIFTNFGRDHLDYHDTLDKYFAAKLRLFTEILPRSRRRDPVAIARGDDPHGRRILDAFGGRKVSFGLSRNLDVYPVRFAAGLDGIHASISALGRRVEISSPLPGEINLLNILGASAMSVALGI
ncbi:MAG: Mur ligase family protein, partial [Candidatus Binataceae bacterium]